jgi:hypothetical protein
LRLILLVQPVYITSQPRVLCGNSCPTSDVVANYLRLRSSQLTRFSLRRTPLLVRWTGMKAESNSATPSPDRNALTVRVAFAPHEVEWCDAQFAAQHYLGAGQPVGDYLRQILEPERRPVGLLVWGPACYALPDRDRWISWSVPQRVERLKLIVQNRRLCSSRSAQRAHRHKNRPHHDRIALLPLERAPEHYHPAQWLCLIRGHFGGVEVRKHWRSDAMLGEDRSRSRNPDLLANVPQINVWSSADALTAPLGQSARHSSRTEYKESTQGCGNPKRHAGSKPNRPSPAPAALLCID